MRILVVSTLYPPVVRGGYEVECSAVVERLRRHHDVLVLTGTEGRVDAPPAPGVARAVPSMTPDQRGALLAPLAALRAASVARRALATRPDLIYSWNGANISQTTLRVLADSGVPLAVRVCEHWFGRLFTKGDQFMRELLPAERGAPRAAWAAGMRIVNRLPSLRLDPLAPFPAAISWNSEAIRRMTGGPSMVEPVFEQIGHSVPRNGERMAQIERAPAPEPEIAYLGRITPYKGIGTAIRALARLRDEHGIPARLVVAGWEDGDTGSEMRALAQQLGVAEAVDWRGPADADGVAEILARAHALLVPSEWDEPFPLVTIEGAFARVPLVASDVGGIGEGMHHDEHALLFERRDAAGAAAALARTLTATEETAQRVERARARAEAFRLEPYLAAQEQFVEEAVEALRTHARA